MTTGVTSSRTLASSSRSLGSPSASSPSPATTFVSRRRIAVVALWVLTGIVLVRISDDKFASWLPESINSGTRRTDTDTHTDVDVENDNRHIPADLRPLLEKHPNNTTLEGGQKQANKSQHIGGVNTTSTNTTTRNVAIQQQPTTRAHVTVNDNHPSLVGSFEPNKTRSIAFVHVGKNGGNTVRLAFPRLKCRRIPGGLYKQMRCFRDTFRPESPLAHQLNSEMHMQAIGPSADSLEKDYTTFLFALRNPVTRAISAYRYLHHNNTRSPFAQKKHPLKDAFYKECFPTLPDLLETLVEIERHNTTTNIDDDIRPSRQKVAQKHSNLTHPRKCHRMAVTVLQGNSPRVKHINVHLRDNYKFYYQRTIQQFPDKEVLVVRTEKLWENIKDLDRQMGGPGVFEKGGSVANRNPFVKNGASSTSITTMTNSSVSSLSTQEQEHKLHQIRNLCCILVDEMKVFLEILNRAVNFSYRNKLETMQDVWATCGIDSQQIIEFQQQQESTSTDDIMDQENTSTTAQPIISFSWSKWHQEQCPQLALRNI